MSRERRQNRQPTQPSGGSAMAKAMTKSQVTGHLADKVGVTKRAAGELLDHLATLAHKEAKNTFTLPGLGKLVLVNREARMGRHPLTGAPPKIPAKRGGKFGAAKARKFWVLGNYA